MRWDLQRKVFVKNAGLAAFLEGLTQAGYGESFTTFGVKKWLSDNYGGKRSNWGGRVGGDGGGRVGVGGGRRVVVGGGVFGANGGSRPSMDGLAMAGHRWMAWPPPLK